MPPSPRRTGDMSDRLPAGFMRKFSNLLDKISSPGSHGRNWSPAETIDDYVRDCKEGLETYSDRHAATILGWSRMQVYRAKLMSEIPADLFEALLAQDEPPAPRQLGSIALALRGHDAAESERCPHCGALLRVRGG